MELLRKIIEFVDFCVICALFLLFGSCHNDASEQISIKNSELDSISVWIKIGENNETPKEIRIQNLSKAYNYLLISDDDSLRTKKLLKIIDQYYYLKLDSLFNRANDKAYSIAVEIKDSQSIAEYHWNKGNFLGRRELLDSAYYHYDKARFLYEEIGNEYYTAKMQFNMSFYQFRAKGYVESEILIIQAIKTFEKLEKDLNLYLSYNRYFY